MIYIDDGATVLDLRFGGLWGQLPEIRFSDLRRGMTYAVMEWCKAQRDANVAAMVFSHFKSFLVCLIDFFIPQCLPFGKFAAGSSSQWRIPLKWIERQGLSLWSSVIADHRQILPSPRASQSCLVPVSVDNGFQFLSDRLLVLHRELMEALVRCFLNRKTSQFCRMKDVPLYLVKLYSASPICIYWFCICICEWAFSALKSIEWRGKRA